MILIDNNSLPRILIATEFSLPGGRPTNRSDNYVSSTHEYSPSKQLLARDSAAEQILTKKGAEGKKY